MFAEVLTFAGTVSGKLVIGGAVAAASVTGAQATGLVDLPGFPDKPETVIVADEPAEESAPLPFEDKDEEPVEDETVEKPESEPKPEPKPVPVDDTPPIDDLAEIEEAADKAEKAAAEKEAAEKEAAEKEAAEKEAAEKEAAEKEAAEKDKKDDTAKEEPSEHEAAIAALEAQLRIDKEAVYAAATALIQPLEAEKKPLVEALESTLATLKQVRNDAKAPLYTELETTTDEQRRGEIEAELAAIYEQWELDRDAAIAAASPAITAIEVQLEAIEIERDAEIARLFEEFEAAVAALHK